MSCPAEVGVLGKGHWMLGFLGCTCMAKHLTSEVILPTRSNSTSVPRSYIALVVHRAVAKGAAKASHAVSAQRVCFGHQGSAKNVVLQCNCFGAYLGSCEGRFRGDE